MIGQSDELRLLEAQLGRMRSMQYRYYELFFRFIHAAVAGLAVLAVAAFWGPTRVAAVLLPFATVFVAFHAAYLFSHVLFARRYAIHLERRINALVGHDLLVAHRLEAVYFGAVDAPKLVAASLRDPLTMLAAETWHFVIAGAGLFAVGVMRGGDVSAEYGGRWNLFLPAILGWAALNGIYLAWHFLGRRDLRRMDRILGERP